MRVSARRLDWPPGSASFRLLAGAVLGLFALYGAAYLGITASRARLETTGDFFGLWSAARFVAEHPAAAVYDAAALHAAQVELGLAPQHTYPFPYPPSFLFALWPLGRLPYSPAYAIAIGATLMLYLWATLGRDWRAPAVLGALLAPTTTIAIVAGQSGFLEAALLAGGFRLAAGGRPIVAGVLLGLLTYKPQIGVLVPVALVAARLWRTIGAAIATFAVLVVATSLAFGAAIWPVWAANLIAYSRQFAAESSEIAHLMPTVMEGLRSLDAGPVAAAIGQALAALTAAGVVWCCFRRGATPLAAAALFVASFLATPHAFVYDMPILATAVLWVVAERQRSGDAFGSGEILILLLAMIAPITLPTGNARFPLVVVSLILLLGMIARRQFQVPRNGTSLSASEQTKVSAEIAPA